MATPDNIFSLPFNEAEAFLKGKLNIPTERWNDLWKEQHAKGFMVAGASKAELLADFRSEVGKAVAGGTSKAEFRKRFDDIVARHGWDYKGGRNWRSDLIFQTNIRTSYQAGRWQQFTESGTKYLRYRHADGVINPRPQHLAWDGLTLPINDPWWSTHYPPNGWGCRCRAVAADGTGIQAGKDTAPADGAYQWVEKKTGEQHTIPKGIDPGWNYNVGAASGQSYKILANKFETLPNDIARAWMREHVNGPAFERFVAGKIDSDFPVAVLRPEDMQALNTQAQTVWMSKDSLLKNKGEIPTRSAGHPDLTLADYQLIPEIVDRGEVYQHSAERLIYLQRGEVVYRAVLKRTKDGAENYMLSLFKSADGAKIDRQVIAKYKKVR